MVIRVPHKRGPSLFASVPPHERCHSLLQLQSGAGVDASGSAPPPAALPWLLSPSLAHDVTSLLNVLAKTSSSLCPTATSSGQTQRGLPRLLPQILRTRSSVSSPEHSHRGPSKSRSACGSPLPSALLLAPWESADRSQHCEETTTNHAPRPGPGAVPSTISEVVLQK